MRDAIPYIIELLVLVLISAGLLILGLKIKNDIKIRGIKFKRIIIHALTVILLTYTTLKLNDALNSIKKLIHAVFSSRKKHSRIQKSEIN